MPNEIADRHYLGTKGGPNGIRSLGRVSPAGVLWDGDDGESGVGPGRDASGQDGSFSQPPRCSERAPRARRRAGELLPDGISRVTFSS